MCILLGSVLAIHSASDVFTSWALAGSTLLSFAALREPSSRRDLLLLALLLPASVVLMALLNHAMIPLRPQTIDGSLMRLDYGAGMAIYRWALTHPVFKFGIGLVYCGLPLFAAFILGISPERMLAARALAVAGAIAPLFYLALPAVGPAHIGDPGAPRNCIPSLHLTWATLLARYSHPKLRRAAAIFVLLTATATLATGEHYIVDLVAALPYTLTIVLIAERMTPAESSAHESQFLYEEAS